MTHDPTCSGCPTCDPELAAVLSMSKVQYAAWLTKRMPANYQSRKVAMMSSRPDPPPSLFDAILKQRANVPSGDTTQLSEAQRKTRDHMLGQLSYDRMKEE